MQRHPFNQIIILVEYNRTKYNDIRRHIWSSRLFNARDVKTWDQILEFYEKDIKDLTEKELEIKRKNLISNIEQKLNNLEFEIAHIKYPCLHGRKDTANLSTNSSVNTPKKNIWI